MRSLKGRRDTLSVAFQQSKCSVCLECDSLQGLGQQVICKSNTFGKQRLAGLGEPNSYEAVARGFYTLVPPLSSDGKLRPSDKYAPPSLVPQQIDRTSDIVSLHQLPTRLQSIRSRALSLDSTAKVLVPLTRASSTTKKLTVFAPLDHIMVETKVGKSSATVRNGY